MYDRLIDQLTSLLRGNLGADDYFPFALQLTAWVRLSKLGKLPPELAFNPMEPPRDIKQLTAIFMALNESDALAQNASAFAYIGAAISHLTPGQLLQALELLSESNLDEPWPATQLSNSIAIRLGRGYFGLPEELARLMVTLAQVKPGERVYLPFEQGFQLTAQVQQQTEHTYSETPLADPMLWLMNLLGDQDARVHIGDSLEKPGFLSEGRLSQFDASVAFPPFGVRYELSLSQKDRFERFPEQTAAIAVLAIRHVLARTRGRAVIAVPNGLLFSPGAERSLRNDLLDKQLIEAVVALPPALLTGTALQFSLLVLRTDSPCEHILFVDGTGEGLYSKDGKGRATLSGWQAIADTVLRRCEETYAREVAVEDVLANDAQLQVARYCQNSDAEVIEDLLAKYATRPLGELVTFIRPIPLSPKDGVIDVFEVGPADFPEYGYALTPGREIKLSESGVSRGDKQFLHPHDIAIATKGSVGKVAILPADMPKSGPGGWVAGQSCLILRVEDKEQIDPRVLFTFLKSEAGQLQLRQIVSGAAVPLIQLRELEKIRIPIPDRTEQDNVLDEFQNIVALEAQIASLRDRQADMYRSIWALA